MKKNYLLDKVIDVCEKEERGKILDLGCGNGHFSKKLKDMGFNVVAAAWIV